MINTILDPPTTNINTCAADALEYGFLESLIAADCIALCYRMIHDATESKIRWVFI